MTDLRACIPERLANIVKLRDGEDKLTQALSRIEAHLQLWQLELVGVCQPGGYYSLACFVQGRGVEAVLKANLFAPRFQEEIDALLANQAIAPRLLNHDGEEEIYLIERVCPGALGQISEKELMIACRDLLWKWWQAPVRCQYTSFNQVAQEIMTRPRLRKPPEDMVSRVDQLIPKIACTGSPVLLHGDFKGENILKGHERYFAIDPEPCLGDREYDLAQILIDPLLPPAKSGDDILRRLSLLDPETRLDWVRALRWALVRSITLIMVDEDGEIHQPSYQGRILQGGALIDALNQVEWQGNST